jgi:manganese transport protein
LIDSAVAMNAAFLVNAAILIVAAATFWTRNLEVKEIEEAHKMLEWALNSSLAPIAFALALLCSGQSSTITGTLAGQITMEGFLRFRVKPWVRRLITRLLAIVPAVCVIYWMGEKSAFDLLIFSQVVLSLQLSFAIVPLVRFTSSKQKMGPFVNRLWVQILAWLTTAIIVSLNVKLVYEKFSEWIAAAGEWRWLVILVVVPISLTLLSLLAWMTFRREKPEAKAPEVSANEVIAKAAEMQRHFKRIGVALDATTSDSKMLAEAVGLARSHRADLVLMHVVDGVGGTWYGDQTGDRESRDDEAYLRALTERLRSDLSIDDVPKIDSVLGYGDASRELVEIARREKLDLVVMGGHGHRGLSDLLYGQTISGVRHGLEIPIIAVRG